LASRFYNSLYYRTSRDKPLLHSAKVKASDKNVHLWYKHKFADVYAIDSLLPRMLYVNHPLF